MKQVLQNASGVTFVRDVPAPPCPDANVLVRTAFSVISSGTERSRVETSQKSIVARLRDRPELALKAVERVRRDGLRQTRDMVRGQRATESGTGYSCSGTIVELGPVVRGLSIGDRVACAGAGVANHAEIVSVPGNLCAKIPAGVSLQAGALTTIGVIALHGVRLADVRLGDRVGVIGCGLVGQITCRLLGAAGAEVFAIDIDSDRVRAAVAGGAHHGFTVDKNTDAAVREATDRFGVDQALVTAASASNEPLLLAGSIARDRAAVVLVGDVRIDVPRSLFFDRELSFRVSRSYGPGRYDPEYERRGLDYPIGYVRWTEQRNMAGLLALQARGALALEDLIEEVIPVAQAEAAYARLTGPAEGRPRGAVAFSYPDAAGRAPPTPARVVPASPGAQRVGLIGPGNFARAVLVPAFAEAGGILEAVAGGSGPSAEAAVREAGFRRACPSETALIADDGVDLVVVATRHDSHARLSSACLTAGKHVFCEKPLALSQVELDEVLAAAAASERVLAVGFNRRYSPHARALREFLADHQGPMSAIYRVSAGPVAAGHWVHDLEEGGGRLIGECCHFLDTLSYLFDSSIVEVHASGYGGRDLPVQAHDNVMLTLTFQEGSVATVAYIADGAGGLGKERLEVFAGSRTAVLDDYRTLQLFDGGPARVDRLRMQDKGYAVEVQEFLAALKVGRNPIALESLRNTHEACFAAVNSMGSGRSQAIDGPADP